MLPTFSFSFPSIQWQTITHPAQHRREIYTVGIWTRLYGLSSIHSRPHPYHPPHRHPGCNGQNRSSISASVTYKYGFCSGGCSHYFVPNNWAHNFLNYWVHRFFKLMSSSYHHLKWTSSKKNPDYSELESPANQFLGHDLKHIRRA